MDSRQQFEEWHRLEKQAFVFSGDLGSAAFLEAVKETLLAAWNASRECIVIELPEKWGEYTEAGAAACDAIDECAANIHATGIRTK
jgi:hypothetical protein